MSRKIYEIKNGLYVRYTSYEEWDRDGKRLRVVLGKKAAVGTSYESTSGTIYFRRLLTKLYRPEAVEQFLDDKGAIVKDA